MSSLSASSSLWGLEAYTNYGPLASKKKIKKKNWKKINFFFFVMRLGVKVSNGMKVKIKSKQKTKIIFCKKAVCTSFFGNSEKILLNKASGAITQSHSIVPIYKQLI